MGVKAAGEGGGSKGDEKIFFDKSPLWGGRGLLYFFQLLVENIEPIATIERR